jgi:hypothetical protein
MSIEAIRVLSFIPLGTEKVPSKKRKSGGCGRQSYQKTRRLPRGARRNSGYISLFKVLGKTFGMPKLTVDFHDVPECQLDFFDVFVAKSTTHYSSPPS